MLSMKKSVLLSAIAADPTWGAVETTLKQCNLRGGKRCTGEPGRLVNAMPTSSVTAFVQLVVRKLKRFHTGSDAMDF